MATESSYSGATTNSYATIFDKDLRGVESISFTIKETGGVNSLDYKVLVRYANYASGNDETEYPETELAANGERWLKYTSAYARMKVQVKSHTADQAAAYAIDCLVNNI